MDWRLIKTRRYQRCCRYSGTVDCPPCAGPWSSWNVNKPLPGKTDAQQVWLLTPGDRDVIGVGNFRMKQDVSSSSTAVRQARSTGRMRTSVGEDRRNGSQAVQSKIDVWN